MKPQTEFANVDFSHTPLVQSLARAYAVILNTECKVEDTLVVPETKPAKKQRAKSQVPQLVQRFRKLYLSGLPESHSKMQKPQAPAKYYKRFHALTDVEIASHLSGRATFAAPLIGRDGLSREVALDIDEGGEAALLCALQIATELGFIAYGLAGQSGDCGHNGGHVRLPLSDATAPERARLLAERLQQALIKRLQLPAKSVEVYPTHKGLRLPFGVHTHSGKRGALLLQDGTRLDLDDGEILTTISRALSLVESLGTNHPDTLPQLPATPASVAPVTSQNGPQRVKGASPIQEYNQGTNLLDWVVSIGGRVAYSTRSGGYLLHCPCRHHAHSDARPSLEIQPARNPRYGSFVLIGHASGCLFATERGHIVDAFAAYCRWYGLSAREAVKQLQQV